METRLDAIDDLSGTIVNMEGLEKVVLNV